jgi:AcrR family transcriptional regulator
MKAPGKARKYDATRRRAAAERTRGRVLSAAHHFFTSRGYAETSVAQIARRARVSIDTVYASVGRKPQLLLAVHDMALAGGPEPVPAEQRAYVQAIREAPTARAKIETYAAALGRVIPQTAPLMTALHEAGATEPKCREVWQSLNDRRAANMLRFAADLRATDEIRSDLSDQQVADLVWSMNSAEFFGLLTSRGLTPEEYAGLLADVWCRTLLADVVPPSAASAPGRGRRAG